MLETSLHTFPVLSCLILIPVIGAAACLLMRHNDEMARWCALATGFAALGLSLWAFIGFTGGSGWLLVEDYPWVESLGMRFTLAMDGLSLLMILLTAILQVVAVAVSWVQTRQVWLLCHLLLLTEAGLMGVFLAHDLVLFYLFWEVALIPMFFIIAVWGGEGRRRAAFKFFLYTLAGSLLLLLAIIGLYLVHGQQTGVYTFSLSELQQTVMTPAIEWTLYLGFLVAFVIKMPLVPFHTWLPDAHTEAPAAGSVDLAGLLLKTGVYGWLRFALVLFPGAAAASLPWLALLALIGIFHAALIAYQQDHTKRLIAYSSISHLGFVVLGIAAWHATSMEGGILQMFNHGITTGALFAMIGMIHARCASQGLCDMSGLWGRVPVLSAIFLFFALASLGLPGLNNFTGEILVLIGTFQNHPVWAVIAAVGVLFGAAYMLRMIQGVIWGPAGGSSPWPDLGVREGFILVPLMILVVWAGIYPETFLAPLRDPVQSLLQGAWPPLPGGMP